LAKRISRDVHVSKEAIDVAGMARVVQDHAPTAKEREMKRAVAGVERRIVASRQPVTPQGWLPLTLSEAHALWQEKGGGGKGSARAVWLVPSSPPTARADLGSRRRESLARRCEPIRAVLAHVVDCQLLL
jgi:hypothetical protein